MPGNTNGDHLEVNEAAELKGQNGTSVFRLVINMTAVAFLSEIGLY